MEMSQNDHFEFLVADGKQQRPERKKTASYKKINAGKFGYHV
jgi:hypothetical protein